MIRTARRAAAVTALAAAALSAQPRPDLPEPGALVRPRGLFVEALALPTADSAVARVDVLYRLDTQYMVSVRNGDRSFPWPMRRRGEVTVELVDSAGEVRARRVERLEIGAPETADGEEARTWYTGIVSLTVPPGFFRVAFSVEDLESRRSFADRSRVVAAFPFAGSRRLDATLFFADDSLTNGRRLTPHFFGDDFQFGAHTTLLVLMPAGGAPPPTIDYRMSQGLRRLTMPDPSDMPDRPAGRPGWAPPPDTPEEPVGPRDTTAAGSISADSLVGRLTLIPRRDGNTAYYEVSDSAGAAARMARLPLRTEALPLRTFRLNITLRSAGDRKSMTRIFQAVWPDMPASLRNVETAIGALRYLVTEQQLDSLSSGSFEEQVEKLEGFWRPKDRTPATAYNEVMTEYYRRVDAATRMFGTLRQPDGFRTDRGRIYVLHGPPSRKERSLDPARGFTETWTYDRPARRFVFLDPSRTGNYTLTSPQPQ